MFPKLVQYYRRTRGHASHDMSSFPYGTAQTHQTSTLDQVAPTYGRGLTQFDATTNDYLYLYRAAQCFQRLIDAEIAQYCSAFEPNALDETLPSSENPSASQINGEQNPHYDASGSTGLHSAAVQNDALESVNGEQQSSVSLPGSSTTPSYSPSMVVTPVEGTYAGPPDSFNAEMLFGNMPGHNGASIEDDPVFTALAVEDTTLTSAAPRPTASAVSNTFNAGSSQHVVLRQPDQAASSNPRNSSHIPPESNGFGGGIQAYNEPGNGLFSMANAPDASYVGYEEQTASNNALPVQRFIDPGLLQAVPPSYPAPSDGVAPNVVETVLLNTAPIEANLLSAGSSGRKRKRTDADEASVESIETPFEKGNANGRYTRDAKAGSKKPKHKLVHTDGRPVTALPLDKIIGALRLEPVNPPDTMFSCVLPGCKSLLLESELLSHFSTHWVEERPNPCPACTKIFKTAAAFGRHLRDVHLNAQELKCSVCNGKVNRSADDQIRRHLTARKHKGIWAQLGLILVEDYCVPAGTNGDRAGAHEYIEDDKGEGSSNGMKRQRQL